MRRALIIQLARLGDLLQCLPAITAIKTAEPELCLDLLCPAPLVPIGRMLPGIAKVLEWDGAAWQQYAMMANAGLRPEHLIDAGNWLSALSPQRYDRAYVLNQHRRALLTGALLANEVQGPQLRGLLDHQLAPWASYVRDVAATRRGSRVHLADAFCGLCGVRPPGLLPELARSSRSLPAELEPIGRQGGPWIGLIVGAGAVERLVPLEVWQRLIVQWLGAVPTGRVVLLGQEQERGLGLQDLVPASMLGRVWDTTGRTSLDELAELLSRCHAVIGADTGPLHLAAAVGTRVIGWYFARARVHETGPYGSGHLIWQAVESRDGTMQAVAGLQPRNWPIEETVAALLGGTIGRKDGWAAWDSHCDRLGAYYSEVNRRPVRPPEREELWRELSPMIMQ